MDDGFILQRVLKNLFRRHFEWIALVAGLLIMGLMNPYLNQGSSWCFFEWIGIGCCPGEGLGHSIAFTFRGDWHNALQTNIIGPFAIIMILSRIGILLRQNYRQPSVSNINKKA